MPQDPLWKDVNLSNLRHSNFQQMLDNIEKQLPTPTDTNDPDKSLGLLQIWNHSNPLTMRIGGPETPARPQGHGINSRNLWSAARTQRITDANVKLVGKKLKDLAWYKCTGVILLSGCNSASDASPGSLPQKLADAAGVVVVGTGGYQQRPGTKMIGDWKTIPGNEQEMKDFRQFYPDAAAPRKNKMYVFYPRVWKPR